MEKKCKAETKKLVAKWKPGSKIEINDRLYKKQKHVYFDKDGPFRRKCAFCEREISNFEDLDHYRPKKAVTNENDKPIKVVIDDEKVNHPGYYWLAYAWNNLLPACKECNSASTIDGKSIGKRNRFPVIGTHACKPGAEENEKPMLLNPVNDDVYDHLMWDDEKKMIVAKPGSKKAKMTIKILGFHQREQLMEDWKRVYESIFLKIMGLMSPETTDRMRKMKRLRHAIENGIEPHSFVAKEAVRNMIRDISPLTNI